MSQKMILLPMDRVKSLEKQSTDGKYPPDVEVKLMRQRKAMKTKSRPPQETQQISLEKAITHMPKEQKERTKRAIHHLKEHKDHINYDKNTGEIQYDGVKAVDSDVRELLETLTSHKKLKTAPKGWDLFMRSLNDTDAPEDVHLGWKWHKTAKKGDWGALKHEQ